jgi:hypothetical protein
MLATTIFFLLLQELQDMEVRLRHGGLGGVSSFERWDKKLLAAKTVKDFVSYVIVMLIKKPVYLTVV